MRASFLARCGAAALLCLAVSPALAAEPQRIVSIGGAVTEILYRLGQGDRIAAVDSTSLFPPQAQGHANVGYMRGLSAEGILALSPDLILMEDGSGPPEAVSLIDAAGVPVVHVPSGHEAGGIPDKIRTVASAVGEETEGEALAGGVARDLARLSADLGRVEKKKRVLFILSLRDGRPLAAGENSAADAMIHLSGAENVLAGTQGYKALSWEAATELQPDAVLVMDRAGSGHETKDVLSTPALAATPAGRDGALISMDALYLLGFGPRTPEAARELAARLYPDLGLAAP